MQRVLPPSRLIIVRHGETKGTANRRYYGRTDMSLNATGIEQAKRLRKWLKRYPLHYIYTSPLKRCKETASIIRGRRKIPTTIIPELQEVDFGKWEGLTLTEMQDRYPRKLKLWFLNFERFQMPGGEKVGDMIRRTRKAWRGVVKRHPHPQESILIVTHGGPAKVMVMSALGLSMKNFWRLRIDTGSVSVIESVREALLVRCINVVP